VPYLSALEVCSRRGAIQIHVYVYLISMTQSVSPVSPLQIVRMLWKGTRPRTGAQPWMYRSPTFDHCQSTFNMGVFIRRKFITFLYLSFLVLNFMSVVMFSCDRCKSISVLAILSSFTQLYFTKLAAKHRKHRRQTNSKTQQKSEQTK